MKTSFLNCLQVFIIFARTRPPALVLASLLTCKVTLPRPPPAKSTPTSLPQFASCTEMPLVFSLCWTILAVVVLLLMIVDLGDMVNPRLLKRVAKWIAALGA